MKAKRQKQAKRRTSTAKPLRAARGSAHLVCPTCDGCGTIPKESIKVTRYQWTAKGAKKVKRGGNLMTSFLTISTISAPNTEVRGGAPLSNDNTVEGTRRPLH